MPLRQHAHAQLTCSFATQPPWRSHVQSGVAIASSAWLCVTNLRWCPRISCGSSDTTSVRLQARTGCCKNNWQWYPLAPKVHVTLCISVVRDGEMGRNSEHTLRAVPYTHGTAKQPHRALEQLIGVLCALLHSRFNSSALEARWQQLLLRQQR